MSDSLEQLILQLYSALFENRSFPCVIWLKNSGFQINRSIESRLQEATLQNDVATTDELLADDWININANGTITDKQHSLELMPKFQFLSIQNEEVQVRLYPGVAVVTGKSTRQLQGREQQVITSRVLFTRVYAQPNGRWQVVTSQATPIA